MFQRKSDESKTRVRSIFNRAANAIRGYRCRLQLEELEQRQLLSVAPAGAEFRVNTYTTSVQHLPSVASDAAGDFVVVWSSSGQESPGNPAPRGYGVYAQRYNAAGVAQGSEFRVNTYTESNQNDPSVAMDSAGDFVVAWQSLFQDGDGYGVYAQRYNAAGVAQGSEFKVNTFTTGAQKYPSVAMDGAGDFVVAWETPYLDGSRYGVYAKRYNAAGVAQGSEFRVNTYTTNQQNAPSVAMDSAGDFVVAWQSFGQDGISYGIYAQRYNAAGVTQGSEFRVDTYTTSVQIEPRVAMDSAGDFVVAWVSGGGAGVYAQRYNAAGVAQGSKFQVNTYTTNQQNAPSVAMDSAGDFVVAWQSYAQDGSGEGVYAQRYNAADVAQGSEFRVNTYTVNNQDAPSVAMDSAGDFVAAWQSNGQDGSSYGIYAQGYAVTSSSVVGRDLFYSGSGYDKQTITAYPWTPLAFSDDNAIATDKSAYLPGSGAATFANVSSYASGINGIMVDLDSNGGSHTSITSSDFIFKTGNTATVDGTWTTPATPTVTVRSGAGVVGSDRVELIWASGTAVTQQWLEVTVKADANTGLQADDHFFFGSELGDNGPTNVATIFKVGAADTTATQTHLANVGTNQPITNIYDYNRDGSVGAFDVTVDQTHGTSNTTGLKTITIATGGPFAPLPSGSNGSATSGAAPAASGGAAVAPSLAAPASNPSPPTVPAWLANRLGNVDLNSGRLAAFFEQLAQEDTAKSRAILVKADQIADSLNLDDALLHSLLAKLGLPD